MQASLFVCVCSFHSALAHTFYYKLLGFTIEGNFSQEHNVISALFSLCKQSPPQRIRPSTPEAQLLLFGKMLAISVLAAAGNEHRCFYLTLPSLSKLVAHVAQTANLLCSLPQENKQTTNREQKKLWKNFQRNHVLWLSKTLTLSTNSKLTAKFLKLLNSPEAMGQSKSFLSVPSLGKETGESRRKRESRIVL